MKIMLPMVIVFLLSALYAFPVDIVTTTGKSYSDVIVQRVEPDGISIKHSAGIVKLFVAELPPDVLEKYKLNAESARQYQADKNAALQAREVQMRQNLEKRNAEWAEREAERNVKQAEQRQAQVEAANSSQLRIRVLSVTADGVLGHKYVSVMVPSGNFHKRVERVSNRLVFVYCNSSGYYDGCDWAGSAVESGTYSYDSAGNATVTVPAYKQTGR